MDTRTWTRRRFLHTAGLAGLAPLAIPRIAVGAGDWSHDFARALEANPALLGWRSVETDQLRCDARIEGRLPPELQGTFYRNGPAVHERFGLRYRHLFDGDGMVQAFRFDGRGITHRARVLATPKLVRETEAGRRLFSGFATPVEDGAPVRRPDDINTANISVLDHHGELLALWEGGSASVLDRENLQWKGFKVWGEGLEGLPFTAHPKVEPDGTLWAFGYNLAPVHRARCGRSSFDNIACLERDRQIACPRRFDHHPAHREVARDQDPYPQGSRFERCPPEVESPVQRGCGAGRDRGDTGEY